MYQFGRGRVIFHPPATVLMTRNVVLIRPSSMAEHGRNDFASLEIWL